MISLDQLASNARPEPARDRWGRYKIPHPTTGKTQSWTRATTFAGTIADQYGLTKWKQRMTAYGVAHAPDLYAQTAAIGDPDQAKKQLDDIVEAAMEAAGSSRRARLGTAMHAFCERVDRGEDVDIPAEYRADVDAYRATMSTAGVQILPELIERIVVVPSIGVAGTFDRVVRVDGQDFIADLKTGRDLSYSWHEIATQLAIYASAETIWDPVAETHSAMPVVNQDRGLVIHLPIGEATCTLWWVDLAAGREAIERCGWVRAWRKRKDLAEPIAVTPPRADEPAHIAEPLAQVVDDLEARTDAWLAGRIAALADQPEAVRIIRTVWGDLPAAPPWTPDQRTQVEAAVSAGEAAVGAPFPAPRPADPEPREPFPEPAPVLRPGPDAGGDVSVEVCQAVADGIRALDADRQTVFMRWRREALRGARGWHDASDGKAWSARTHAAMVAITACLEHLWDDDDPDALTRAALRVVLGGDAVQPAFTTGALLGTLSPDESRQLTQIAAAFGRDEPDVVASLGLAVA